VNLIAINEVNKTESALLVIVGDDVLLALYVDNVNVLRRLVVGEVKDNFGSKKT
jgi:hypothetical protein